MSADEIDWNELARVMREERDDKLYPLWCVQWPGAKGFECLSAPSYYEYIKALGFEEVVCCVIDGEQFLMNPGKYVELKTMLRQRDAERGWT